MASINNEKMANLDEKALKVWGKCIIVEKFLVEGKEVKIDTDRYRQDTRRGVGQVCKVTKKVVFL